MSLAVPLLDTASDAFERGFQALVARRQASADDLAGVVREILAQVRERGDAALLEYAVRFDGVEVETAAELVLSGAEIAAGARALPREDRAALELAASRIRRFHERSVPQSWLDGEAGNRLGQLLRPLGRVGIYVPGFQAPLASTTLMLAVPAQVAGVREIVMASSGSELHPAILAAAELSGVSHLVRLGGAQAVAALAYGTESVPRVEKIVGPGSAYTQAAKLQVFGEVAIDAEAGPSEVFIVADASAPARYLAADLLAQAEHTGASVALATPSETLARETLAELEQQLPKLPFQEEMRDALEKRGALLVTRDLAEAVELANRYAAEHLQLYVDDPDRWLPQVENAGAIFIGPYSPVPLGDYVAGPSHVLPTGGTARFFSVVGVEDFLKRMSVVEISRPELQAIGPAAIRLAELEGLQAHAEAVRARLNDDNE